MATPRCFIVRHGETEWSLSGKHTGATDIPLTANGEKRVRATGRALVGEDRLIVPQKLVHIYVSPRQRAQRTLELLDLGCHEAFPWQRPGGQGKGDGDVRVEVTEDIAEWNYGDYEGVTSSEIRRQRKQAGEDEKWDIWKDGCPGGESPEDVCKRVDRLIGRIRTDWHEGVMKGDSEKKGESGDVLVVAHGHILRAFAMRWVGMPLAETKLIMEAGGVGTLSYEHHSIYEPAILLGGGFVVGDDGAEKK